MEEVEAKVIEVGQVLFKAQQQGQPTMELVCHQTYSLD